MLPMLISCMIRLPELGRYFYSAANHDPGPIDFLAALLVLYQQRILKCLYADVLSTDPNDAIFLPADSRYEVDTTLVGYSRWQ